MDFERQNIWMYIYLPVVLWSVGLAPSLCSFLISKWLKIITIQNKVWKILVSINSLSFCKQKCCKKTKSSHCHWHYETKAKLSQVKGNKLFFLSASSPIKMISESAYFWVIMMLTLNLSMVILIFFATFEWHNDETWFFTLWNQDT